MERHNDLEILNFGSSSIVLGSKNTTQSRLIEEAETRFISIRIRTADDAQNLVLCCVALECRGRQFMVALLTIFARHPLNDIGTVLHSRDI